MASVRALRQRPVWPAEAIVIPAIGADGSLSPIGKMEAHRSGALHLAVSVFVFSGEKLLLQRRAAAKYHCGLMWANTCCSHPNWGERPEAAAQRRLFEELGLRLNLVPAGVISYRAQVTAGLVENERVQVFRGEADAATLSVSPNPDEVSEIRWATPDVLRQEADERPDNFAPWFRIYLARWPELEL